MTNQPSWKKLWSTDDAALFQDTTGVYDSEMEVAQDASDDGRKVQVFRFSLERLVKVTSDDHNYYVTAHIARCFHDGTLPHPIHSYKEWYLNDLGAVASFVGSTRDDLIEALCCEDAGTRAEVYRAIGDYHGFANLDGYPREMTRKQWERTVK
jgi:S-adenosylmethionine:diacylglycerol 3-amino-3-carboxypropyl transferase